MSRSSYKSCIDGAGTANKRQESEAQRHGWETRRRNRRPGRASRCGKRCGAAAPCERALLGFAAQSLKLQGYAKAGRPSGMPSSVRKKAPPPRHHRTVCFKTVDGVEPTSTSGVSETAARPPCGGADGPGARVSRPLSAPVLTCSLQAGPCMPAAVLGHGASQDPRLLPLLLFFLT